jgi:Zn-dependent protease with chaperone function
MYRASGSAAFTLNHEISGTSLWVLYPAVILFETFFETFRSIELPIGRERELIADAVGARITTPRIAAAALAKIAAFAPHWGYVHILL